MKFSELSTEVQKNLVEGLSDSLWEDWYDCIYDDFSHICTCLGIDVHDACKEPDISFSGFYSQGDGASFGGRMDLTEVAGCGAKMREHAPNDTDLHEIADQLELAVGKVMATTVLLGVDLDYPRMNITNRERYHTHIVDCNILEYNSFGADIEAAMIEQIDTLIEEVEAVVTSLASWLYRTLQTEYEYQTSEQMLIDQDENYDEEGEIIYEQPTKHTGS
jgi:hypothetical protein